MEKQKDYLLFGFKDGLIYVKYVNESMLEKKENNFLFRIYIDSERLQRFKKSKEILKRIIKRNLEARRIKHEIEDIISMENCFRIIYGT